CLCTIDVCPHARFYFLRLPLQPSSTLFPYTTLFRSVGPCVEDVDVDESSDGVDADDDSAGHEVERVDGEREREVRLQAHGGLEYGGSRWGGRPDGQPGDGQRGAHQEVGDHQDEPDGG